MNSAPPPIAPTSATRRPSAARLLASWHAWTAAERGAIALCTSLFLLGVAIRLWRACSAG